MTDPGAEGAAIADSAAVVGLLRAGLTPREAFVAVGWGESGDDGAPPGAGVEAAVAARLAHATGAPLAPILEACAVAARAEAEASLTRDTALAGPRLSARVLAWLPVVGLVLAVLVDASVLGVLATPLGLGLLASAAALTAAGRLWMRRLVARAAAPRDATGLALHAVRAAMIAGADVASALAGVAMALEPERELADDATRMRTVALALAAGTPWAEAWANSRLSELEKALALPWERGAHAAPILFAAAEAAALDRRRRAQIAASELAVRLTLPLALCLLPAFVLAGIVPLLVALVGGLR
jgi:tight adherence protein B